MTVVSLLIFLVVLAVIAWVLYLIITKFFPPSVQMPALAIVGVLLIVVTLSQLLPEAASYRIWR